MTNQIALWLGLFILALLGADYYFAEWSNTLFLLRKLEDFIEYLAFWR